MMHMRCSCPRFVQIVHVLEQERLVCAVHKQAWELGFGVISSNEIVNQNLQWL